MPSTDKPASPVIPSLAPALLVPIVSISSSSEGIKILDLFDKLSAAAAAYPPQLETDAHNSVSEGDALTIRGPLERAF